MGFFLFRSQRTDGAVSAIESLLSFGRVATSEDESQIKEITEILFAGEKRGEALVHFFYFRTSKDIIEDVTLSAGE